MRRLLAVVLVFAGTFASAAFVAGAFPLPNRVDSVKFGVIGDNGTGEPPQYDIARQMAARHQSFPFDLVIMLGDNFYGSQRPADLLKKFDRPYQPLLDAGVRFRAALGNHDEPDSVNYPPLNMNGQRYYTFAKANVRFIVLDSNSLDRRQLSWFEDTLKASAEDWKICYFHHPLYSNADRHGDSVDLRVLLEPMLVRYGVNVVFSGHDHSYERLTPQKGVHYFVSGAGGQLRKGGVTPKPTTAAAFDDDQSFMLVEIAGAEMFFEAVSRIGSTVDSGVISLQRRRDTTSSGLPRGPALIAVAGESRGAS